MDFIIIKVESVFNYFHVVNLGLQIIQIRDPGDGDADYYLGEKGMQKGRVPRAFLEVMDD